MIVFVSAFVGAIYNIQCAGYIIVGEYGFVLRIGKCFFSTACNVNFVGIIYTTFVAAYEQFIFIGRKTASSRIAAFVKLFNAVLFHLPGFWFFFCFCVVTAGEEKAE